MANAFYGVPLLEKKKSVLELAKPMLNKSR